MPKGNNGNSNCQRRSNCCPGGIEEQQPIQKQLSSIPEESSNKNEASESVQAKVELFELKSRASHEVHEKAEHSKQPVKKPVNTVSQEVHEEAEQPKKPVKKPLKRLAKKPKKAVTSQKIKDEKAEQPKKPVKKPVNTASKEVHGKAEQPKKPLKKRLKRLAKKPKVQVQQKSKSGQTESKEAMKNQPKKPVATNAVVIKPKDKKVQEKSKSVQAKVQQKSKSAQTKDPQAKKNSGQSKATRKLPNKSLKQEKPVIEGPSLKNRKRPKTTKPKDKKVQVNVNQKSKSVQTKKDKKNLPNQRAPQKLTKKVVKSKKPKDEQPTLNSPKGAETPNAVGKSGMDDKKAHIGDISSKDLFKAIQFAAIKQKNQRSYMSEYKLPSINIDIAMANMLAKAGEKDKVLLQAIFLHDLVDWTNTSLEEIKEEFGAGVASVVEEVTSIDKGGKFDRELGGKASKEAVNGLSKNGQLIRLSDLLWQMTMLVEAREERDLTSWEKQRITDVKEEMAHYGKDTNSNIFAALDKAMDILIKSSIM